MGLVFICSIYIFKDFIIHVSWGRTSYLLKSKKINSRNAAHSHLQYGFRLMYFATKEEGGVIPELYKPIVMFYLNWVILKKNCLHAKIHHFACQYRYNAPTSRPIFMATIYKIIHTLRLRVAQGLFTFY